MKHSHERKLRHCRPHVGGDSSVTTSVGWNPHGCSASPCVGGSFALSIPRKDDRRVSGKGEDPLTDRR